MRIRTIKETIKEIKKEDSGTAFTECHLRELAHDEKYKYLFIKNGKKTLVKLDLLMSDYLGGRGNQY